MFNFFRNWGRKKQHRPATGMEESKETAPGTEIHYHPDLVPDLLNDHQALLALFGEIDKTAKAGRYHRLPAMLDEFGSLLRNHLLKENVKLYIYLQHALVNDPDNSQLMRGFRTEMHGISKAVSEFLAHYSQAEWDPQQRERFGSELEGIGEVLVKRIETEERVLYPLYMPPDAYT